MKTENAGLRIFLIALVMLVCGLVSVAHASVNEARSVIYFDEADNIIGQRIIDCRNYSAYAGNVDSANQNFYQQSWSCGSSGMYCDTSVPPHCQNVNADPGYSEYIHTATGRGMIDYCSAGNAYIPGVPFSGRPDCGSASQNFIGTIQFLPFTIGSPGI